MNFDATLESARCLDHADPLAGLRDQFFHPAGKIYLDGNSLGLLSRAGEKALMAALEEWKRCGIEGWMEAGWFTLAERLGARIAPLLGADPSEVIVANSTTVNLHQLLCTFFRNDPGRSKILAAAGEFPSDIHAIKSHLRLRGVSPAAGLVRVAPSKSGLLEEDDLISAMGPEVQLVVLPAVLYTTGQLLDLRRLTEAAHARGILIGFDCAHSIGAVPHELKKWDVDFAFWCTYKYLGGGPGSVGGLFVHARHLERQPGMAGWFGNDKPTQFKMSHELVPAAGAGRFQIGTPPLFSMAPLIGALDMFDQFSIEKFREKSIALTRYLIEAASCELSHLGFTVATPRDQARRGGHVALRHVEAGRIGRALKEEGIVTDHRPPDIIRLAPVAAYNSFEDCFLAVQSLKKVMCSRLYEKFSGASLVP